MDGAGLNIFDRIEQKLCALGVEVDNSDIKNARSQVQEQLDNDPENVEFKMNMLELRVLEIARLLESTVNAMENSKAISQPQAVEMAEPMAEEPVQEASEKGSAQLPKFGALPKGKKYSLNAATGMIEQVEDTGEDNFIVADGRAKFGGGKGGAAKKEKKCVFIAATDDESVKSSGK
jgi:hypothetical protein